MTRISSFISTLHSIVTRDDTNHIIQWSLTSDSFLIHSITLFTIHIMPLYTKSTDYSSFTRQLNIYGFTRVFRGDDVIEYMHQGFTMSGERLGEIKSCRRRGSRDQMIRDHINGHVRTVSEESIKVKVLSPVMSDYPMDQQITSVSPDQITLMNQKLELLENQVQTQQSIIHQLVRMMMQGGVGLGGSGM